MTADRCTLVCLLVTEEDSLQKMRAMQLQLRSIFANAIPGYHSVPAYNDRLPGTLHIAVFIAHKGYFVWLTFNDGVVRDNITATRITPFSTAAPFWGQTTWNLTGLSP